MKKWDGLITILGVILLGAGLFMIKTMGDMQGIQLTLSYILVGTGCGIFGHGMSRIISKKALSKDEKLQKQLEIEKNDERNITISNKAKSKAYDCMTFVFGILMLIYALINVDMIATILLVVVYLFVHFYGIFFRIKYEKEM